ncbi:hypothetical protein MJO28_003957 [Puccinia striiformis f. sp. tritici]|uniref:Uncharacterized protein n=1 Tax=Puccinia striiformis f. sp. tritici TaxID=168172 RepID=A0ACC0ER30_9BASI|nr:hypothetical protein MJO28_003957 [Puccinia striiformis f. sp. tritici]
MGQVCWKCNHPFRGCPETCHRFLEPEELGDDRYLEQIKDKLFWQSAPTPRKQSSICFVFEKRLRDV